MTDQLNFSKENQLYYKFLADPTFFVRFLEAPTGNESLGTLGFNAVTGNDSEDDGAYDKVVDYPPEDDPKMEALPTDSDEAHSTVFGVSDDPDEETARQAVMAMRIEGDVNFCKTGLTILKSHLGVTSNGVGTRTISQKQSDVFIY